ncbi:MAG TPA: hypothetical protein VNR61_17085 [Niallia sp.]|nr:hypothetical protein [Niallia sp.]
MVTIAYLLIFTLMSVFTVVLDIFVFHDGLFKCIRNIYEAEVGAGAITIVFTAILGFVWSVVVDIRLKKRKKQAKQ